MNAIQASCPICDGVVILPEGTEVSEIISCGECSNKLVVDEVTGENAVLSEAPEVEEDWGE